MRRETLENARRALRLGKLDEARTIELGDYVARRYQRGECSLPQFFLIYRLGFTPGCIGWREAGILIAMCQAEDYGGAAEAFKQYSRARHEELAPAWIARHMRLRLRALHDEHERNAKLIRIAIEVAAAKREQEARQRVEEAKRRHQAYNREWGWSSFDEGWAHYNAHFRGPFEGFGVPPKEKSGASPGESAEARRRNEQAEILERVARDSGATDAERENARRMAARLRSKAKAG